MPTTTDDRIDATPGAEPGAAELGTTELGDGPYVQIAQLLEGAVVHHFKLKLAVNHTRL